MFTQALLCCVPLWPAVETKSNAMQGFYQHNQASRSLSESLEQHSHSCIMIRTCFFSCPSVVGRTLLCGQDVARKSGRSWVGTKVAQVAIAINLALSTKMADVVLSYTAILNKRGKEELITHLAMWSGTSMWAVSFFMLQMGITSGVQHSSLCSLADPAALFSGLWKQNFTNSISLSIDF